MGKIVMGVLALFLLAYVVYQAVDYFYEPYRLETVYDYTFQDTVSCRGVFIRDEEIVAADYSGVPDYIYKDGSMISKGMAIAEIYPSGADIRNIERVSELEAEIDMLRDSQNTSDNYLSIFDTIGSQISDTLGGVVKDMRSGNVSEISGKKTALMTLVNRRNIIAGTETDYEKRITELENQIESLRSRTSEANGYIFAEEKGYFSSANDGYENVLYTGMVDEMSIADVTRVLEGKGAKRIPTASIGKMVTDFRWYYAAVVSAEEAERFREGAELTLMIDMSNVEDLPVKVYRVIIEEGKSTAVVVLSCSYMSEQLSRLRTAEGRISFGTVSGLRIPDRAVRMVGGVKGVFVRKKQTVRYRPIEVVYSRTGFVIVKWDRENADGLQIFDEIFVEGNDLYDGKQVE